jgi:3D (Asp-Asp-Asp) domain-containing protein
MNLKIKKSIKKVLLTIIISITLFISIVPQVKAEDKNIFSSLTSFFANLSLKKELNNNSFPTVAEIEPRKTVTTIFTAYSSDVAQTDDSPCIPAMHTYNLCENYEEFGNQDTIAANFLPLGTKVKIPELYGDKIFTVRDRMNSRYGYARADIWMPTYVEAKSFGVKKLTMEIYYR